MCYQMSRSRKKTPILGVASGSCKKYKKQSNRRARRVPVDQELPHKQAFGDEWGSPRDGKYYMRNPKPEDMRK